MTGETVEGPSKKIHFGTSSDLRVFIEERCSIAHRRSTGEESAEWVWIRANKVHSQFSGQASFGLKREPVLMELRVVVIGFGFGFRFGLSEIERRKTGVVKASNRKMIDSMLLWRK
jgi:hypothetical protein